MKTTNNGAKNPGIGKPHSMNFTIETLNDSGSGMNYATKEEFMKELSLMIDDCIENGGTFFDVQVDSDASCFLKKENDGELFSENDEDDFLSGLLEEAAVEEMIGFWIDALLESTGRTSVEDLTQDEIQKEIEEVKGTIQNEKVWALAEPIHYDNIVQLQAYLEKLEEMKEKAKS